MDVTTLTNGSNSLNGLNGSGGSGGGDLLASLGDRVSHAIKLNDQPAGGGQEAAQVDFKDAIAQLSGLPQPGMTHDFIA